MPEQEKCVRQIQAKCAQIATQLDTLAHDLHRLREVLQLPPDVSEMWEFPDRAPWPVEVELVSAIGIVIEEDLDDAAQRLRKAARVTAVALRSRHRTEHLQEWNRQP